MAHFAKLDDDNVVIDVLVVDNDVLLDDNGVEIEQKGIDYLTEIFGHTNWKQTSYNQSFRQNYAEIDGKYDADLDAFLNKKPYDSWTLDTSNYQWVSPEGYPDRILDADGKEVGGWEWDEAGYLAGEGGWVHHES